MLFKSFITALVGASAISALVVVPRQCVGPKVNQATIDLVKSFESWQPNVCKSCRFSTTWLPIANIYITDIDPVGKATVGYGHLCSNSKCTDVPYPIPLSMANGEKLLASDLAVNHLFLD